MVDQTVTKMTAAEFAELPETNKLIELINGEVVVAPSPVDRHQEIVGNLHLALRLLKQPGVLRLAPADVHLDEMNVVQPDLFWIRDNSADCQLVDGTDWHGAPDLVIEILSPGTTQQDRQVKYQLYERSGVREYWLVDAEELYIEVYVLTDAQFMRAGLFGLGEQFASSCLGVSLDVALLLKS